MKEEISTTCLMCAVLFTFLLTPLLCFGRDQPPEGNKGREIRESSEPVSQGTLAASWEGEYPTTVVAPRLDFEMEKGKNLVWCATLQLLWNELRSQAGGSLGMEPPSELAEKLESGAGSEPAVDEESVVALAGLTGEGVLEQIRDALREKFDQSPPPALESLPPGTWLAYARLFKTLPFQWAFQRFSTPLEYAGSKVACFGIYQYMPGSAEDKVAGQVVVLDYGDHDDFILELKTRSRGDRLILAKVPPSPTLEETVQRVSRRMEEGAPTEMGKLETLMIPVVDFDVSRVFHELSRGVVKAKNPSLNGRRLGTVMQQVRFKLDETGAVLQSDAIQVSAPAPRSFVFDGPFLLLLKRTGASAPYFVLWAGNAELLAPY